jgi:hypothetical protein
MFHILVHVYFVYGWSYANLYTSFKMYHNIICYAYTCENLIKLPIKFMQIIVIWSLCWCKGMK